MAQKRINVRFGAQGSREVRTAMEGIGEAGDQAMRSVAQRAREMGESIRTSLNTVSRQARRVGLALSAVGAGVTLAVRQQISAADEMGKAASRIGVSVEELSALAFAAELSGSNMRTLEKALTGLSRRAVDTPDKFAELGVALRDANGEMRPTRELLADVADALAALPAGAERTGAAMDVMGRSGTAMLPMLEGGAAGLRGLTDQAEEFGAVVSTETAANAAEFNDNLSRLSTNVGAITRQITETMLPALLVLSERFLEVMAAVRDLPPEAVEWFARIAAVVAVGGPLLLGLAAVAKAAALIASPFVLVGAAVAGVVAGLVLLVRHFDEVVAAIETGMGAALEWLRARFEEFRDFLAGFAGEMVQIGRDVIQGFADGIMEKWDAVKGRVEGVFTSVTDGARRLFGIQSPSRVFAEIGAQIMAGLSRGLQANTAGPADEIGTMAEAMQTAFGGVERSLQQMATTGRVNFRQLVSSMVSDLSRLGMERFFTGPLSAAFGGMFGGAAPDMRFAGVYHDGGVVGAGAPGRMVPAGVFAGAQRFHSGGWPGLGPNEVPAILERGERVLSRREARAGGGSPVVVNIQARDAESFRAGRTQIAADIGRAVRRGQRGM